MTNTEFYLYEGELWCKQDDRNFLLDQSNTDVVEEMMTRIRECYPKAYAALTEIYKDSAPNKVFYRYIIVRRFLKCNFALLDSTSYDTDGEKMNFERVPCPLRLECKYDGVICSPLFKTTISEQEMKVGRLWYNGLTKEEIAGALYLSPETVNNHIRNIYYKLAIHEKADFVKYVDSHNIYGTDKHN